MTFVIECEELQQQISGDVKGKLLLVDVSSEKSYLEGHIPNSVNLLPSALMCGEKPAPGRLPSTEKLHTLMSSIGLTPDTHVVAYDDEGGGWAGRLIWTLDVLGHRNYSYLNGGKVAWRSEGLPLTNEISQSTPSNYTVNIDRSAVPEIADILQGLKNKNLQIWDARSPEEYRGEKILAAKGGHIPGAINCEWTSMMDPENGLRFRTDAEARLKDMGLEKGRAIITHCQSHHRSGFTYILGKTLGFDIKAYHGSWSEWGNHPDTPVEQ